MKILERILNPVMRAVEWFLIGVLGVMSLVVLGSAIGRYLFGLSVPWSDPLARYGQTWIMLLGSAVVLRKGMHIGVDNFVNKLPPRGRQVVFRLTLVLIAVFSATMAVQGFRLIEIAGDQIIPEMGLRMRYIYTMIPVSGALLVLTALELLFKRSIGHLVAKEGEEVDG